MKLFCPQKGGWVLLPSVYTLGKYLSMNRTYPPSLKPKNLVSICIVLQFWPVIKLNIYRQFRWKLLRNLVNINQCVFAPFVVKLSEMEHNKHRLKICIICCSRPLKSMNKLMVKYKSEKHVNLTFCLRRKVRHPSNSRHSREFTRFTREIMCNARDCCINTCM